MQKWQFNWSQHYTVNNTTLWLI